jgi:hypothetical protein
MDIKSFEGFLNEYYNPETGNEIVPGKYAHLNAQSEKKGVVVYKGSNLTKPEDTFSSATFPKAAAEWLHDGVTMIAITGFEHSWFKKYDPINRANINPKYQSELNGTWGDTSLPLFTDDHPDYEEVNFDIYKAEPNTIVNTRETKNGKETLSGAIFLRDKDGNEFAIHSHMLDDVIKGGSIEDDVIPGSTYMIDKMRGTIVNYIKMPGEKEGVIVVKLQNAARVRYSLAEFRAAKFHKLDESEESEEGLEELTEAKATVPRDVNKGITKDLGKKR